jgi:hypothetical protein
MTTYHQNYYRKNREKRKAASKAYRESHKKEHKIWCAQYYKLHPFTTIDRFKKLILVLRKEKIKKSDCIWSFAFYQTLVDSNKCHYCCGSLSPTGYNLDRKDNALKHIGSNVVACCRTCNYTKNKHFSYDEMMLLSPALKRIQSRRRKKNASSEERV